MSRTARAGVVTAVYLGWWLRLPGFFANTFQADEALFATWARIIAVWRDPLLAAQPLDKPPLLFYLQALFYPLLGPELWAARVPGLMAGILLLPIAATLAWRWQQQDTAIIAAAFLMASSPLLIQFSPTAYTDPLLTTLLLLALLAVVGRRPGWSGLWFGLALWTKYQALLLVPLLLGAAWQRGWRRWQWLRAGLVFASMVLLLPLWELTRTGSWSLWQVQMASYGGVRVAWSWELWPRLLAWLDLLTTAVGAGWLLFPLLGLAVVGLWRQDKVSVWPAWLLLFSGAYLAVHWLLAIPIWDRYLLPIWPLLLLAAALGVARLLVRLPSRWLRAGLAALALALLLPPALAARHGRYSLGSYPTADDGAGQIATLLADAPYGTVLYDHWYSWQWRYYFFDKTVYVSWFAGPAALQADLAAFGRSGPPRYLALPPGPEALPVKTAVAEAGFRLQPVAPTTPAKIALFRLLPEALP